MNKRRIQKRSAAVLKRLPGDEGQNERVPFPGAIEQHSASHRVSDAASAQSWKEILSKHVAGLRGVY